MFFRAVRSARNRLSTHTREIAKCTSSVSMVSFDKLIKHMKIPILTSYLMQASLSSVNALPICGLTSSTASARIERSQLASQERLLMRSMYRKSQHLEVHSLVRSTLTTTCCSSLMKRDANDTMSARRALLSSTSARQDSTMTFQPKLVATSLTLSA